MIWEPLLARFSVVGALTIHKHSSIIIGAIPLCCMHINIQRYINIHEVDSSLAAVVANAYGILCRHSFLPVATIQYITWIFLLVPATVFRRVARNFAVYNL